MEEALEPDLAPISEDEIFVRLNDFPDWEYRDNKICKTFEFVSFSDGIFLLNHLAPFCNQIDHHPDVYINYKKFRFDLTRYSIGGKVTERDFVVARKIEQIYRGLFKKA